MAPCLAALSVAMVTREAVWKGRGPLGIPEPRAPRCPQGHVPVHRKLLGERDGQADLTALPPQACAQDGRLDLRGLREG